MLIDEQHNNECRKRELTKTKAYKNIEKNKRNKGTNKKQNKQKNTNKTTKNIYAYVQIVHTYAILNKAK